MPLTEQQIVHRLSRLSIADPGFAEALAEYLRLMNSEEGHGMDLVSFAMDVQRTTNRRFGRPAYLREFANVHGHCKVIELWAFGIEGEIADCDPMIPVARSVVGFLSEHLKSCDRCRERLLELAKNATKDLDIFFEMFPDLRAA